MVLDMLYTCATVQRQAKVDRLLESLNIKLSQAKDTFWLLL